MSEGLIMPQDIKDAQTDKSNGILSNGLPSYCILQTLLRSIKANSDGILLRKLTLFLISKKSFLFLLLLNLLSSLSHTRLGLWYVE